MLRPACLPPGERPLPHSGLSTLRFGHTSLLLCREPATRRIAAYRDGTFTRWIHTARRQVPVRFFCEVSVVVATHHAPSISAQIAFEGDNDRRALLDMDPAGHLTVPLRTKVYVDPNFAVDVW